MASPTFLRITSRELQHMAADGGWRAEPILNTTAAADGHPLKVVGFTLLGPRRNRKVIEIGADGLVDFASVKLWCDCVAYATAKIESSQS